MTGANLVAGRGRCCHWSGNSWPWEVVEPQMRNSSSRRGSKRCDSSPRRELNDVRPRVRWRGPRAHAILGRMGRLDYYAVLRLGRDATTEEVKAVYRQLARTFHPDANVEATKAEDFAAAEHFKKITEAYTVLSDPEKRALYDRYGESWREAEKKGRS